MTQPVFYKDLFAGHRNYSENDLGRKGLSLALLVAQNVPVPPFFILRPDIFQGIIATIFQDTSLSTLEGFREKILSIPLTPQLMSQIEVEYQKLSGFGKAWVAVRSSISAPLHKELAFSGLLHSYLNIRSANDIEKAIKDIFVSLFHDRTYDYFKSNKISYGDVSSAIIVQKMVQSEVSGVMYTYDPITMEKEHVSIEAVFGLGDVLADGNVNPDIYTVSKSSLEIIEKKIVPQDWMKVRKVGDNDSLEHIQKISISKMWQYSQKLDDSLIRELTKLADNIEKALGGPQVIEWAMERGNIYVLQSKSIEPTYKVTSNPLTNTQHKITSYEDINNFTDVAAKTEVTVLTEEPPKVEVIAKPPGETLMLNGTPASSGVAYGEAFVLNSVSSLSETEVFQLKEQISKKHILVADEFSGILEPLFTQAGGIITNYGGVNSDAALTSREMRIPAIVGTRTATSYVKMGTLLKIDGSSGAVFRVDFIPEDLIIPEEKPMQKDLQKEFSQTNELVEKPKVKKNLSLVKTPDESATKVFLYDSIQSNYVILTTPKDALPKEDISALILPISDPSKQELLQIKRLKRSTAADIYLLISDIPSLDALLKVKRLLASKGIRRTKRVKLLLSINSVYGLLNSKNLVGTSVDGIIYDCVALATSYMPGSTSFDTQLWSLLGDNIDSLRDTKLSFLGMSLPKEYFTIPLKKELTPILRKGVNALLFPQKMDHALAEDVSDIQKEMLGAQLGK